MSESNNTITTFKIKAAARILFCFVKKKINRSTRGGKISLHYCADGTVRGGRGKSSTPTIIKIWFRNTFLFKWRKHSFKIFRSPPPTISLFAICFWVNGAERLKYKD